MPASPRPTAFQSVLAEVMFRRLTTMGPEYSVSLMRTLLGASTSSWLVAVRNAFQVRRGGTPASPSKSLTA